jgi:hypothetical protein
MLHWIDRDSFDSWIDWIDMAAAPWPRLDLKLSHRRQRTGRQAFSNRARRGIA